MAHFALHNLHTGSAFDIKLEIVAKLVAVPERYGFRVFAVIAFGDKRATYSQRGCHVADQGRKKIASRGGSRSNDNCAKRLLSNMPFGVVIHQADHPDDFSFRIVVRSEGAGFPNVFSIGRMLGNEQLGDLYDLSRKRPLEQFFNPARPQAREDLDGNSPKHLVRTLSRQALHGGVEYLVAQFGVVNDDAFRRALNDFLGKLICLAQRVLAQFLGGNVSRKSENSLRLTIGVQYRADHDIPPTALARNPGREETGETSEVSLRRSFDCQTRCLAIRAFPEIDPGRIQHRRQIADLEGLHASFIHELQTTLQVEDLDAVLATGNEPFLKFFIRTERFKGGSRTAVGVCEVSFSFTQLQLRSHLGAQNAKRIPLLWTCLAWNVVENAKRAQSVTFRSYEGGACIKTDMRFRGD